MQHLSIREEHASFRNGNVNEASVIFATPVLQVIASGSGTVRCS